MAEITKRPDRAEIAKRVERAEKLLQKGKTGDALEEYMQILTVDPQNDSVRQTAADLFLSLQRTNEAVKLLSELFERQVANADNTRASLTYKKLSRYINPSFDQKVRFAQILETSNRRLAVETYESGLVDLMKQGQTAECLPLLTRIVTLEPSEKNLQRFAELSSESGDSKASAAAFLKLAEFAQGGNAGQWFERAYAEDPGDPQIALGYGKSLLTQGQAGAAIFVLEPQIRAGAASPEMRETYAKALLATGRLTEAEPLIWQMFEQNPSRLQEVTNLIAAFLDAKQDAEAVALARKLEKSQRGRSDRRALLASMQDLAAKHHASAEMLEFMSELFNTANREGDYCQTLLKLFDVHCNTGNYAKAAECLDRAADVDPYESGHQKRLEMLRGKIDDKRYKVISARFTSFGKVDAEPVKTSGGSTLGAGTLQDLMLQAEILVQYGMRSKATERLHRIQELFPHEEERNQELQQLYLAAGMTPRYSDSHAAPTPRVAFAPAKPASTVELSTPKPPVPAESSDVSDFTRVAEITRKLYRQGNADAVMTTAVNEIAAQWKVSRCIVAMRKPGLMLSAVKECCAEGTKKSETSALGRVISAAHDLAISRGNLTISDVPASTELQEVSDVLRDLNINSLLVLPLSDGQDQVGLLILGHTAFRSWPSSDIVVLKTISDQIVIALNNAGLRRLVKSLTVTDEQSGLLNRASYLDLLMAESRRAVQQSTPVTVLLMQFGESARMVKEYGEKAAEAIIQQIGRLFAANVRQNDLAFRYEMTTIALVLGETAEKEATMALEKLRKLLAEIKLPDGEALPFNAGMAEAVIRQNFDAVDIVTEVINRVEGALEKSLADGLGTTVTLSANLSVAAVA
jgi:diguanylate cyclase (GGDEF)-like protein